MTTTNDTTLAQAIITALVANGCKATATHTAAPGKDWGYVEAWPINDRSDYAIRYSNNAEANYALTDDISDLADWIMTDEMLNDEAQVANARNADPKNQVDANYQGPCGIIRRRDYYGPTSTYEWLTGGSYGDKLEFDSGADAQQHIDNLVSHIYMTAHNESGAPTYFIIEV